MGKQWKTGRFEAVATLRRWLAPAQDVAEVVRRAQRHLGDRGEALRELLVGPNEAVAHVLRPFRGRFGPEKPENHCFSPRFSPREGF